jgi:hypothetical protein
VLDRPHTVDQGGRDEAALQSVSFFLQTLHVLLQRIFDAHVKVQVAACSALCILSFNSFSVSSPLLFHCLQQVCVHYQVL